MTPRQFTWLRERHKHELEYQELLWAINTSTLANHSFNPPKKAYKPYDFMPTKLREKHKEKKRRWTRKGFAKELIALRSQLPSMFVVKPVPNKTTP